MNHKNYGSCRVLYIINTVYMCKVRVKDRIQNTILKTCPLMTRAINPWNHHGI